MRAQARFLLEAAHPGSPAAAAAATTSRYAWDSAAGDWQELYVEGAQRRHGHHEQQQPPHHQQEAAAAAEESVMLAAG